MIVLFFTNSDVLNQYIIDELHRNGVDLCNKALMRLLSKRERRENEAKLTIAQKKLCRIAAVDMWDVRVVELCDLVREVDSKVTSFQKEVEKELQLADEDQGSVGDAEDFIGADAFSTVDSGTLFLERHRSLNKRRAKSDDQHPHASLKRKQSSGHRRSYLELKRRHQGSRWEPGSIGNSSNCDTDDFVREMTTSSVNEITSDDRTNHAVELIEAENATSFEPVDFVGDMDDLESSTDESIPVGRSCTRKASRNIITQQRHSKGGSSRDLQRGGSGLSFKRRIRPMADSMSDWLGRQKEGSDSERHQKKARGRQSSGKNISNAGMRQASTDRQESETQPTCSRILNKEPINKSRTRTSISIRGSCSGIPHDLSAETLFDSIIDSINRSSDRAQSMNSGGGRTWIELCCELKDLYPCDVPLCQNILDALTTAVVSTIEEHIQKDDIITLLHTLLSIFQMKCTTLLDMIQKSPDFAYFQINCWCLVFRMFEKKMNECLCPQDGLIFKIFGNRTNVANHILLQIVDALYSQLSCEEYGQAQTFNSRVYDELRSLCIRIGYVVPLLPTVCELLTRKLGRPRWHLSLIHDQKENEPEKALFVSAIDPFVHKGFMTSGDYLSPSQGVFISIFLSTSKLSRSQVFFLCVIMQEDSRVRSFKYRIPREEIGCIWSIIGFCSGCSNSNQAAPDFKQPQQLLAGLVFYDCGTLPKTDRQLPPSKLQLDTCCTEIKWISVLLLSRLLGDIPSMDSFLKQIIERSVVLEACDVVLNVRSKPPDAIVQKTAKKLWEYSCVTGVSADLQSFLQAGLDTSPVYCACPSTILLQRCVSLAALYASMIMIKNTRWKNFRIVLISLASEFVKRALHIESKLEQKQSARRQSNDFSVMFHSIIESATDIQITDMPASSYFRDAACYLMLAGVVARSRFNAPGEGSNFHLNDAFRENVSGSFI